VRGYSVPRSLFFYILFLTEKETLFIPSLQDALFYITTVKSTASLFYKLGFSTLFFSSAREIPAFINTPSRRGVAPPPGLTEEFVSPSFMIR